MLKLNNKGFAIASILYSIMVLFLILLLSILGMLGSRKATLDKNKKDILNSLNYAYLVNKFVFQQRDITVTNGRKDDVINDLMAGVSAIDKNGNTIGSEYIRFDGIDLDNIENRTYTLTYTANNGGDTIVGTRDVTFVAGQSVTVTLNANGGSVGTSTANVYVGGTYGELPIPTRTGYVFKGWNGNNLFDINVSQSQPSSTAWSLDTKRTFTVNTIVPGLAYDNYFIAQNIASTLSVTSNSLSFVSSSGYGIGYPVISGPNRSYNFSYSIDSSTQQLGYVSFYKSDGTIISYTKNEGLGYNNISFTTPAETYYLVVGFGSVGQNQTVQVSNIQLKEESVATDYEPYYITSTTRVVQNQNHTLTAIWGTDTYMVSFDANGGTVNNAHKTVTYNSTYGDLPTPTREGYEFEGWKQFPSDLQQVEYIEANGSNELIDTGYIPTPNTGVDIDFAFSSMVQQYRVFGVGNNLTYQVYISGGEVFSWSYNDNSGNWLWSNVPADTNRHRIYFNINHKIIIDNESVYSADLPTNVKNPSLSTLYFAAAHYDDGGVNFKSKLKIYSAKIYENGVLVRDFIPCKSSNNEYGLYDRVEGRFHKLDTTIDSYNSSYVTANTNVTKQQNHTLTAIWEDSESPTLALSKITYIENDFSNWTLSNATVSNGVLTLGANGNNATAESNYIDVNGDFWYMTFDGYTETLLSSDGSTGSIYWDSKYYDSSKATTTALTGKSSNGYAVSLSLNEWKNELYWSNFTPAVWKTKNRYGSNVKYIKIKYTAGNDYSKPPVKIRNLKIYGEAIPNSFYLINVSASDNLGISTIKYASGNQNKAYFATNGTNVTNNQIRVTANGTYTVYVADAAGNGTVQTIQITNIA